MKKFLGKLGRALAKGAPIAAGAIPVWGPIITAFIPGKKDDEWAEQHLPRVADTIGRILEVVLAVEIGAQAVKDVTLTGEQKLAMVLPQVRPMIEGALGVFGKKNAIRDDAKFNAALAKAVSGFVDAVNELDPKDLPDVD
jgi:hypothetical protein